MKNNSILGTLLLLIACFSALAQSKKEQIEILSARLDSFNRVLDEEKKNVLSQSAELKNTTLRFQNKVDSLDKLLANTKQELKKTEKDLNDSKTELQAKEIELSKRTVQQKALEDQISELTNKNGQINTQLADANRELKGLVGRVKSLEDSIGKLKKPGKKALALNNVIGHHNLINISGFRRGEFVDFSVVNSDWKGIGSGKMGDDYYLDLTKEDKQKLKSISIDVSEDLTLTLSCNGKDFLKLPFKEDSMGYFLKKEPSTYLYEFKEKIDPRTTFLDKYLYLCAQDLNKENEEEYHFLDIAETGGNVIIVKLNSEKNQFEVQIGESTFKFNKKG